LFFDSIGGEQLGVRLINQCAWQKITLYRKVPESGKVQVTLALRGLEMFTSTIFASNR